MASFAPDLRPGVQAVGKIDCTAGQLFKTKHIISYWSHLTIVNRRRKWLDYVSVCYTRAHRRRARCDQPIDKVRQMNVQEAWHSECLVKTGLTGCVEVR